MTVARCLMLMFASSSNEVLRFSLQVVIVILKHRLIVLLHVYDGRASRDSVAALGELRATTRSGVGTRLLIVRLGVHAGIGINLELVGGHCDVLFLLLFLDRAFISNRELRILLRGDVFLMV